MSEGTKTYRYGNEEVTVGADMTTEEVREAWLELFPGIADARVLMNEDGVYEFVSQGGDKGQG